MANPEHLKILMRGVVDWNEWRQENPQIAIDLSRIEMINGDLAGINLKNGNLRGAKLIGTSFRQAKLNCADFFEAELGIADMGSANLGEANLNRAILVETNLTGANLRGASLKEAEMFRANLYQADLDEADFSGADLSGVKLIAVRLNDTNLTDAKLDCTVFASTYLRHVKGLESCQHYGCSSLDYNTLIESGPLPEAFLRGCGLSDEFIDYLPSFWNHPFAFYSCFISYSHQDKIFAHLLHDRLQARGIRCWRDEKQLDPGVLVHRAVDEGVRKWDKVLLCCSKASLHSWWVDKEIQKALMKEERLWKERGKEVLTIIPLNLDGFLFDPQWDDWKKQHLTTRFAADFVGWKKTITFLISNWKMSSAPCALMMVAARNRQFLDFEIWQTLNI